MEERGRRRQRVKRKANVTGMLTGGPRGTYDRLIQRPRHHLHHHAHHSVPVGDVG